jgi:hypothetical protein
MIINKILRNTTTPKWSEGSGFDHLWCNNNSGRQWYLEFIIESLHFISSDHYVGFYELFFLCLEVSIWRQENPFSCDWRIWNWRAISFHNVYDLPFHLSLVLGSCLGCYVYLHFYPCPKSYCMGGCPLCSSLPFHVDKVVPQRTSYSLLGSLDFVLGHDELKKNILKDVLLLPLQHSRETLNLKLAASVKRFMIRPKII